MPELNSGKIEVELKAWLDQPAKVTEKITELAKPLEEVTQEDKYYTFSNTKGYQNRRFRLRRIGKKTIVTVKIVSRNDLGIEANFEHEFEVSDPESFETFCKEFGFRLLIEKHKKVRRFAFRPGKNQFDHPVTIELNHVADLGDFIELETIVDRENEISKANAFLKSLLDIIGVSRSKIELAAYTELLYKKLQK